METYQKSYIKNNNDTNKIKCLCNLYPNNGQAGNVYDIDYIAPTLMGWGAGGGGKEVKIVELSKEIL